MVLRGDPELDESATRLLTPEEAAAAAATTTAAAIVAEDGSATTTPFRPRIRAARWQVRSPRRIILLVSFAKFCIVCSGLMLMVPMFRLIEDAICHGVLDDASPGLLDEMTCKDDDVQARLATFMGWSGLVNSIVTLITAFPFGAMSDRFGRKPTALLAYLGLSASFFVTPVMLGPPLRQHVRANPYLLLWGSLFQVAGGGIPVLLQTLYAMAADVSSEEEKSTNFLYVSLGSATGGLLGPLLAGVLMTKFGPWVPIWIVIGISPSLILLLLIVPETLAVKTKSSPSSSSSSLHTHLARGLADLRASLSMLRNPNVPLILVTFLFQNARMTAYASTLVQYVSKNYGWTLGQTSILLSPLGVLALVVLGTLPRLAARLTAGSHYTVFAKDLLLTRGSTACLVLGAAIQAFSPNIAVFVFGLVVGTLGAADTPLARATVSHYVHAGFTSRLYALIGAAEVLGSFVGAPVLAWLFNVGLEKKGLYTGLPYFYIAILSSISLLALMFVRPPPRKEAEGDVTPESEGSPGEGAIRL
ncbi:hypothetical protein BM221_005289 [Beauveria bassiana]|uniref:Major facilitator superfamily (MFS) profile domain-containing protein n=1 Tax=Beauveria bassiana TaxID=176275 RepID=A0A2N6NN47_BEABA|nr:hypothetical protein BM221_005289 [Beauveria bassiana]